MGLGRGIGRNMGRGGGMGRCMDHGMGRVRRMLIRTDLNKGYFLVVSQVASPSESDVDQEQVEAFVREQAQVIEGQKYEVEQRMGNCVSWPISSAQPRRLRMSGYSSNRKIYFLQSRPITTFPLWPGS